MDLLAGETDEATSTYKQKQAVLHGDQSVNEPLAKKLSQSKFKVCALRPHRKCALFVAWSGVIVLVYDGFPVTLVNAKKCIQDVVPDLKLEHFGSRWPKTTLGALDTDEDFTLEDMQVLRDICLEFSSAIACSNVEIPVRAISLVEYICRSLERISHRKDITLEPGGAEDSPSVSREELATTDGIVGEWSDLSSYLHKVNSPGSRIDSYRSDCRAGATCVVFLDPLPIALKQQLDKFRLAIEQRFPGRYKWMEEKSLHCTLRSLDKSLAS